MSQRYNIYYAGQVLAGHAQAEVREKLRKVFKADDATLDKLFSGKAQLLKRECDKATALKYKQAMEKAGAQPIIKSAEPAPAEPAPAPPAPEQATLTAAERIAALAAAEDVTYQRAPAAAQDEMPAIDYDGEVEPVGADILRASERRPEVEQVLPDPQLALDEAGARLGQEPPAPPPAPAVDHLDMAGVGETIPNLPPRQAPLQPDTGGIALAPEGTDFTDCAPPPAAAPAVDLTGMDMAPAGADVLEEQYRRKDDAQAPATDHIRLAD